MTKMHTFFSLCPVRLKVVLSLATKKMILIQKRLRKTFSNILSNNHATSQLLTETLFLGKGGLGSTKFVAFETLAWHNDCFYCALCKDSMVGKGFIQVMDYGKGLKHLACNIIKIFQNIVEIIVLYGAEVLFPSIVARIFPSNVAPSSFLSKYGPHLQLSLTPLF